MAERSGVTIRNAGSDDHESDKSAKQRSNKKDLSPEQREELLSTLKTRFEKNMNRHKGFELPKYKQSWKLMLKNCGHSMKWKELAVNRTLLVTTKIGSPRSASEGQKTSNWMKPSVRMGFALLRLSDH